MIMWIIGVLIIVIILIITIACLSMLSVHINYEKLLENSLVMTISLKLFGITYYKKRLNNMVNSAQNIKTATVKEKVKTKTSKQKKKKTKIPFPDLVDFLLDVFAIIIVLLRKIKITKFNINVTVGNGDAAMTAMLVSLLWGTVGITTGVGQNIFCLDCQPEINIYPDFQQKKFTIMSQGIFNCRCGYIIWTATKLLLKWQRVRKNAVVPML